MPIGPIFEVDADTVVGRVRVFQTPGAPPPIPWTTDLRVLSVVRAAYASRRHADLTTQPSGEITRIFLLPIVAPPPGPPPSAHPLPPLLPPGPGQFAVVDVLYDAVGILYEANFQDHLGVPMHGLDPSGLAQAVVDGSIAAHEHLTGLVINAGTLHIDAVKISH